MKSIIQLSKQLNADAKQLNDSLIRHGHDVSTTFGVNDGFIDDDVNDHIQTLYNDITAELVDYDHVLSMKSTLVPINIECCIYFLMQGNIITYVGQSFSLLGRIQQHILNNVIPFDTVSYIAVDRHKINLYERMYIHSFAPKYNTTKYTVNQIIDCILKLY